MSKLRDNLIDMAKAGSNWTLAREDSLVHQFCTLPASPLDSLSLNFSTKNCTQTKGATVMAIRRYRRMGASGKYFLA